MQSSQRRLTKTDVDKALTSPVSVFQDPMEVVGSQDLTRQEKLEILKRWELDSRALQRATDENMAGGEPPQLDAVNKALAVLDPENRAPDAFGKVATKI
jgi:hypothetical protein